MKGLTLMNPKIADVFSVLKNHSNLVDLGRLLKIYKSSVEHILPEDLRLPISSQYIGLNKEMNNQDDFGFIDCRKKDELLSFLKENYLDNSGVQDFLKLEAKLERIVSEFLREEEDKKNIPNGALNISFLVKSLSDEEREALELLVIIYFKGVSADNELISFLPKWKNALFGIMASLQKNLKGEFNKGFIEHYGFEGMLSFFRDDLPADYLQKEIIIKDSAGEDVFVKGADVARIFISKLQVLEDLRKSTLEKK